MKSKKEKSLTFKELEVLAEQPDKDFAVIETLIEDSEKLLKEINVAMEENEKLFVSRLSKIDSELAKEKENARAKAEALKEEKEKSEKDWSSKYDSLKKESNEKIDKIEASFKERERNYKNRENELTARIYDLNEMRLKRKLNEQAQAKQKEEIEEKLKSILGRINILLKDEKKDS